MHEQLEQQTVAQLTPVLNSTQLAKFQILMKMHHAHFHGHGHGGPPPAEPAAPRS